MGNATSCPPSIISSSGATKVLSPDGHVHIHTKPITAGEIMVENSGYFVCESGSLKAGHRVAGLAADQALQPQHFYFLLPMDILYSALNKDEITALSYQASKANRRRGFKGIGKIFPMCIFPLNDGDNRLELTDALSEREGMDQNRKIERAYSKQRSWKPALDTIVES